MTAVLLVSALFASTALPPETDAHAVTSMKRERIALYLTAAADIVTTRHAIMQGATEGNPILSKLIGKAPSAAKLIGVKLAAIGLIEWFASRERNRGNYKLAKALYALTAMSWGYAAGFNMSWAFR